MRKIRLKKSMTFSAVLLILLTAFGQSIQAKTLNQSRRLAIIKGFVQDELGNPIVGALISIFSSKNSKLLKQTRTDSEGGFLTKILPGAYTIVAFAEGFNSQKIETQINKPSELLYGFKLERIGSGRTIIEKKPERSTPKYVIRSATLTRSIYQNRESDRSDAGVTDSKYPASIETSSIQELLSDIPDETQTNLTVLEFYNQAESRYFQFARVQSIGERTKLILIGQDTDGFTKRFRVAINHTLNSKHRLQISSSFKRFQPEKIVDTSTGLDERTVQLIDEWKPRPDLVIILGLDYSGFNSVKNSSVLMPHLGVQLDVSPDLQLRSSFSAINASEPVINLIKPRDINRIFRATTTHPVAVINSNNLFLKKSNRFETTLERAFENKKANLELTFLFDSTNGQSLTINPLENRFFQRNKGLRISYSRRLNPSVSLSASYALGEVYSTSSSTDEKDFYQAFIGQLNARLKNGARLQAVLKLSPKAKLFAIDPFQGKFTIYDPNLSIVFTQALPTFGLPMRAEAIIDFRNILDQQQNNNQEKLITAFNGRSFRGGIAVKF